jgi:membrane protease YdiL (CAAX protease family)
MKRALLKSAVLTLLFTAYFIWNIGSESPVVETLIASGYFMLLYFTVFSIGKKEPAEYLNQYIGFNINRAVLFPTALVILYYSYILIHGGNPFQGTVFMLPFLIYFPTLVFVAKAESSKKINWLDFATFALFLLPTTLVKFSPQTNLPFSGGGFDSVYRIVIMLAIVYAFVVIRNLKDVGFYPVFKLKYLGTAVWVWLVFYAFVFVIGYAVDFFKFVGYDAALLVLATTIGAGILHVFLHTALFEELFFRGLLQNLLAKRIAQTHNWETFWKWGGAILLLLALATGSFMKGNLFWFPALTTLFLFAAAFAIERLNIAKSGTYTALAITSLIFGLVHFHSGSIIFVGLASIGGWAYGYTYIKTKNVFYAALVHALVNNSHLIFGIELLK